MRKQITPRRVKVERGIYYRQRADGRHYEIGYVDSSGRWRMQAVDGGLRGARQARADILSRLGRGERIAPTARTVADVADAWLAYKGNLGRLRPRTRDRYEQILAQHVKPQLGKRRVGTLRPDDLVALMAAMRHAGSAEATIRKTITLLGTILGHAVRRGWIGSNPVRELERDERPVVEPREMRVLTRGEIAELLDAAMPVYRPLLATAILTGLRFGELLGLRWSDLDLEAGVIRVRRQLERWKRGETPQFVEPKTPQAIRDVVLTPTLASVLREHKKDAFGRGFARPEDLVFCSETGRPLHQRNVTRRGLERAVQQADLGRGDRPTLRFHDLRHTFASILIAEGMNVVFVSRQLGHADPAITLRVYAHLFDQAEHAQRAGEALDAVRLWSGSDGERPEAGPIDRSNEQARIHEIRDQRELPGAAASH